MGVVDEARGGRRQPAGQTDFFDVFVELGLEAFEQVAELFFLVFARLFGLFLFFFGAEVHGAFADGMEGFAVELGYGLHPHFVHGVGEQEDFVAFVAEGFEVGGIFDGAAGLAGSIFSRRRCTSF